MTSIKQFFNFSLGILFDLTMFTPGYSFGQEKSAGITLNGYLRDSGNGESLIGAAIYVQELSSGTVTNAYGFYSLTLPEGTYTHRFQLYRIWNNIS